MNAFKSALSDHNPLQIVGTINAYSALLAQQAGHKALYLSGGGVANASLGLPDLAITHPEDLVVDSRRIFDATGLPLLVDIDTGFGGVFNIQRTMKSLLRAGVAAVHLEDQMAIKRCGHRPNKVLVTTEEMCDRVRAARDATGDDIYVIARTDAIAPESLDAAIERSQAYVEAGAQAIFLEGARGIEDYRAAVQQLDVPVLANMTEFGKTPLESLQTLKDAGVAMVLYPLSAFRAMSKAAELVYTRIKTKGDQRDLLDHMQTREQLYDTLGYYAYEEQIDAFNRKSTAASDQ